jgi:hypothetical protein
MGGFTGTGWRRAAILAVAATVLACPRPSNNGFPCSPAGECPDGYSCLADRLCWKGGVRPGPSQGPAGIDASPSNAVDGPLLDRGGGPGDAGEVDDVAKSPAPGSDAPLSNCISGSKYDCVRLG